MTIILKQMTGIFSLVSILNFLRSLEAQMILFLPKPAYHENKFYMLKRSHGTHMLFYSSLFVFCTEHVRFMWINF
jgi:hypothetical protein